MIPRIKPPSFPRTDTRYAFGRGEKGRLLRIVVDPDTAGEGEAVDCLGGFAHHPLVEILTTGADRTASRSGTTTPRRNIAPSS